MCLTFFFLGQHPQCHNAYVMCFNRDEKVDRPTLPFAAFQEDPNIFAGRDLISKGTWLGVNIKTGIFVWLTNYDLPEIRVGRSRGKLVYSFLSS